MQTPSVHPTPYKASCRTTMPPGKPRGLGLYSMYDGDLTIGAIDESLTHPVVVADDVDRMTVSATTIHHRHQGTAVGTIMHRDRSLAVPPILRQGDRANQCSPDNPHRGQNKR